MMLPTIGWFCKTVSAYSELDENLKLNPISIDTRTIQSGDIFWALKGTRDGHDFVETAFKKNAIAAVVEKQWFDKQVKPEFPKNCIVVENTLHALQLSAACWRKKLSCQVLGITRTNGKTSTKDLVVKLLELKFETHGTSGNFNNYIGLPLTILKTPLSAEILVLEMGASYPHEIGELCRIAQPTLGLVTSITKAHLEGFGSLEVIADTKGELYDFVAENGVAFVPLEYPLCVKQSEECKKKYGYSFFEKPNDWSNSFLGGTNLSFNSLGQASFKIHNNHYITLINPGRAAAQSALAALSVAEYFGLPAEKSVEFIASWEGVHGRTHILKFNNLTLIDDSYNANPASVRASLDLLKMISASRRIAILGDMNELGSESKLEHLTLGRELKNYNLDLVIFCGDLMQDAYDSAKKDVNSFFYRDYQSISSDLSKLTAPNDTILIKASRSVKLENIAIKIKELYS